MRVWQGTEFLDAEQPDLVLVTAPREGFRTAMEWATGAFPEAATVGCTGAGQIEGTMVDDEAHCTAIAFDQAKVHVAVEPIDGRDGAKIGAALVASLPDGPLRHVLLLSDGLHMNGTDLAAGAQAALPAGVSVTGGLAGDGDRFDETWVGHGLDIGPKRAVAIGFYGETLRVGFGSMGGWDSFGPQRRVTHSDGNVLYALDGRPALDLYKEYLGDHAAGLPATGLLFPLYLPGIGDGVVRTILSVDEDARSLTFAGDVPEGAMGQMMKANFDRLVDGASGAADRSSIERVEFAWLVSCIGRRLVLKQRTEDELDAVHEVLGEAPMAGFYSYGEICPAAPGADCQLHNQTMTITTFSES